MMRKTVILFSLISVLLLAGLCSCKQEISSEKPLINAGITGVTIPEWEKSGNGLTNLPAVVVSGTDTGVSEELLTGLENPPEFSKAKNLIVIVCEGLTTDLIDNSAAEYGELILDSFPVMGTTTSKFTDGEGKILAEYIINDLYKNQIGICAWKELSANSMRRMTTTDGNEVSKAKVGYDQFIKVVNCESSVMMTVGRSDYSEVDSSVDKLNDIHKASAVIVNNLKEAIELHKKDDHYFYFDEARNHYGPVKKLCTIFKSDKTLPSFRQEAAFSLAWMQSIMDEKDGFALLMTYSMSTRFADGGIQDFDEAVAVAVKFVLENPDTALLICGCPEDGSEAEVCFYGLGKDVSAKSTFYECVSSIF